MTEISTEKKILKILYSVNAMNNLGFFDVYTLRTLIRSVNFVIIRKLKFGLQHN